MDGHVRRARLALASLYLCVGARDDLGEFLDAVLGAGVDVVQLRDKQATATELLEAGAIMRDRCRAHEALFVVNDRADIAVALDADGVHVGQDDLPPDLARAIVGREMLIGRSTHVLHEVDDAIADPDVDYLGVGPVHATPTKPGRPGTGLGLVGYVARATRAPFFVTGGMDARTIPETRAAGARGFVVVRAIADAPDPVAATRAIRVAIGA